MIYPSTDSEPDAPRPPDYWRNEERRARRQRILITRWFVPWRLRKWMPDLALCVRDTAQREFERRAWAHLNVEWNR